MSVSPDSPLASPTAEPTASSLRGASAVVRSQASPARIAATDGELLTLFVRNSDRAAFDRLVDRHAAMVWRVCRQALRRREDAEDAFQATFLLLVRNARSIRSCDSIAGWLYRVAYRTAVRARKRLAARREESLALDPEAPAEVAFPDLLRKQTTGVLMEELRRLPSQYQTAMILRYLEGQSRRAIADQTDTTVAAVQGRLARGKRMLRRRLLRRGVSLSAAMGAVGLASRRSEAAEAAPAQLVAQTTTHSAALATGGSLAASAAVMSLYREGAQAMLLTLMAKPAAAAAVCGLAVLVLMQPSPAAGPALHEESIAIDAAVPAPATRGEHTATQLLASTAQAPGKASSSQPVSDDLTRADAESNTDLLKWMHKLKRLPTFDGRNRGVPVGEKEPLSYEQREARIRDRWLRQLQSLDDPIDLGSPTWEEQEAQFQAAKERYNQLEKRVSFLLQRRAENKANLTPEEWIEVELEVGGLFADLAEANAKAIRLKRDLLSRAADTQGTAAPTSSAVRGESGATLVTDGRLQVNPDEPGELKITSADGRQALQIAYEPEDDGATASINASLSQPTDKVVEPRSTLPTFAGPHAAANRQVRDALRRPLPDEGLRLDNFPLSEAIKLVADEYDIEARLDLRSLDELGISPDEPVSIDMGRGSLSAALEILLEQLELQAVPRHGVLTLVTNDRAAKMLEVGVYEVGDLLAAHPAMTSQLTETIQRMVEPGSWGANGGDAEVSLLPTGTLVVSQAHREHEQVAALLDSLRTESKGPTAQQRAKPTPHSGSVVEYWDDGSKKSIREYDDGRLMYAVEYTAEGQQTLAYEDEGPGSEAPSGAATIRAEEVVVEAPTPPAPIAAVVGAKSAADLGKQLATLHALLADWKQQSRDFPGTDENGVLRAPPLTAIRKLESDIRSLEEQFKPPRWRPPPPPIAPAAIDLEPGERPAPVDGAWARPGNRLEAIESVAERDFSQREYFRPVKPGPQPVVDPQRDGQIERQPTRTSREAYGATNAKYGHSVEELQAALNKRLDPSPNLDVDGDYGPNTSAAVRRFQKAVDLEATGFADEATRGALGLSEATKPTDTTSAAPAKAAATKPATSSDEEREKKFQRMVDWRRFQELRETSESPRSVELEYVVLPYDGESGAAASVTLDEATLAKAQQVTLRQREPWQSDPALSGEGYDMTFAEENGQLAFGFGYGTVYFYSLGEGELVDFAGETLRTPAQLGFGPAPAVEDGHVYFLDQQLFDHLVLFRVRSIDRAVGSETMLSKSGKPRRFGGGGRTETFHEPSEYNPDGWATIAELQVGGSAPVLLPRDERPRPGIVVEALTPESVTVYVEDPGHPEHHNTMEVANGHKNAGTIVVRGRPVEVVYQGHWESAGDSDQPGAGNDSASLVIRGRHDNEPTVTKPLSRLENDAAEPAARITYSYPVGSIARGGRNMSVYETNPLNPLGWVALAHGAPGITVSVVLPGGATPNPKLRLQASTTDEAARLRIEHEGDPRHLEEITVARDQPLLEMIAGQHVQIWYRSIPADAPSTAPQALLIVRGLPKPAEDRDAASELPPPSAEIAMRMLFKESMRGSREPVATKPARRVEHHDGKADGKKSLGGSGHLIRFELPEGVTRVKSIRIHGSRYGTPKAPNEDFEIGFLGEDRSEILAVEHAPYGLFRRGEERWVTVRFDEPVALPRTFWLGLDFNPGRTKGIYVSYDTSTGGERSMTGRTQGEADSHEPVDFGGDWMVALIPERPESQAAADNTVGPLAASAGGPRANPFATVRE